jgi:hypothetical protein
MWDKISEYFYIKKTFRRIKVKDKKDYTVYQTDRITNWPFQNPIYPPPIDVIGQCVKPSDLPYAKDLPKFNPDIHLLRENCSRIVLRGDNRSIGQIKVAGGFHPNATTLDVGKSPQPLNLLLHRKNSTGSGYISSTRSPNVAQSFGITFANLDKGEYTIYALRVNGAVYPSTDDIPKHHIPEVDEHSIPGGIDSDEIVAFRKCKLIGETTQDPHVIQKWFSSLTRCGDVFFNRKHEQNNKVIKSLLFNGESIASLNPHKKL